MKRLIVLLLVLSFFGCATVDRVAMLEKKVVDLENRTGSTEMAGASFYPFTGGLTGGGTGALDKMTSLTDKDVAFGVLQGDATYGNAFFAYTLDDASALGDVLPDSVDSGDVGTDWLLAKLYGSEIIGRTAWGPPITTGTTIGDELTEVWNKAYIVEAACIIVLPAAATVGFGSTVMFIVKDVSETVTIDPADANKINLHGTPLDAGDTIDSPGAAGDFIVLIATTDADGSGTDGWRTLGYGAAVWTDGGQPE